MLSFYPRQYSVLEGIVMSIIDINNKKLVLVNATALSASGALTILRQFLANASADTERIYLCFVPDNIELQTSDNILYKKIKKQSFISRVIWDLFGVSHYIKKNKLKPCRVISLQNTSIRSEFPQIVYVHQPIPFSNIKLKFNSKNIKFLMYKYIYSFFIFLNIKNSIIVVQTHWMKDAILQKNKKIKNNQVIVISPTIDLHKSSANFEPKKSKAIKVLYPATPIFYKNHTVVLEALNILNIESKLGSLMFQVTFGPDSYPDFASRVKALGLEERIEFLGVLPYEDLVKEYEKSSAVVFPSYLETFGLPLAEAAVLGKLIICSDLPYTHDVLNGYQNVKYVHYDNPIAWSQELLKIVEAGEGFNFDSHKFEFKQSSSWNDFFKLI